MNDLTNAAAGIPGAIIETVCIFLSPDLADVMLGEIVYVNLFIN